MKIRVLIVFSFLFVGVGWLRCVGPTTPVSESTPALAGYSPQIRSFSVLGADQASFVVEGTRDFRVTTDQGNTWQTIKSQAVGNAFECATMTDPHSAWAVNHEGEVLTKASGGGTWRRVYDLKAQSSFTGAKQIEFVNATVGWILESLSIWRTNDGGNTWRETLSVLTAGFRGQPTRLYPIDDKTLIVTGTEGQICVTKDGGETWNITRLADDVDFRDVSFADQLRGWICGSRSGEASAPVVFRTTDGGTSWIDITPTNQVMIPSSVSFVGNQGWLAGHRQVKNDHPVPMEGVLLHTTDGGTQWTTMPVDSDDPFFSIVRFINKEHGWLTGRDGIYRTEDGGKTWRTTLKLPPLENAKSMKK